MVEGPGCKLKGERVRTKLTGQSVKKVSGSAVVESQKAGANKKKGGALLELTSLRLEEVQTLGKELFMFFGKKCLRVHFLMDGSIGINDKLPSGPESSGSKSKRPILVLEMSKDNLFFYQSAVDIRCSQTCREKYEQLRTLDICSPVFSAKTALCHVMEQPQRLLCDVLLDQNVLPGVGNIIKNEALFDSGIKPDTKVCDLTEAHLRHLIKMTRDFSMLFYECRKTGVALSKYMKVYGRESCNQCQSKVVLCRMGDDNNRVTYFCPSCQTNELRDNTQVLPQKNSLLGWLHASSSSSTWTCTMCTLVNQPSQKTCVVCLSARGQKQEARDGGCRESAPKLGKTPCNDAENTATSSSLKRKLSSSSPPTLPSTLAKRPRHSIVDNKENLSNGAKPAVTKGANSTPADNKSRIPSCSGHAQKCVLREVRKQGENSGRMFFACSLQRAKQCQFFKWADESFPICPGHGKPCTLRTVMKLGQNNGRKFFACAVPRKKQCTFFQWAEGYG